MFIARNEQRLFPTNQVVMVNKAVEFICYSHTNVKWTLNSGFLHSNTFATKGEKFDEYILRIEKATFMNNGVYGCQGSFHGEPFLSTATLKVHGMRYHRE